MNKIVPIITICLAVITFILNAVALVCACFSLSAPPVQLVAVPTALVGLVSAGILTPIAFLFKKDMLCRISFYIDIVSLLVAIAAVSVGFAAI